MFYNKINALAQNYELTIKELLKAQRPNNRMLIRVNIRKSESFSRIRRHEKLNIIRFSYYPRYIAHVQEINLMAEQYILQEYRIYY